MAKRGPKLKITPLDWEKFDKLCFLKCTLAEIAGFFDCSEDTIERAVEREHGVKFADYWRKKSQGGTIALRRWQMQKAEKGNVTMLIWLGKQRLGQTDKGPVVDEKTGETQSDMNDAALLAKAVEAIKALGGGNGQA